VTPSSKGWQEVMKESILHLIISSNKNSTQIIKVTFNRHKQLKTIHTRIIKIYCADQIDERQKLPSTIGSSVHRKL